MIYPAPGYSKPPIHTRRLCTERYRVPRIGLIVLATRPRETRRTCRSVRVLKKRVRHNFASTLPCVEGRAELGANLGPKQGPFRPQTVPLRW